MELSQVKTSGNFKDENTPKILAYDTTDTLVDFVQAKALLYRQKELARITGLSLKQVQNLRMGISGISGKTLTNWCKNDPVFGADYAAYCGIILPGDARMSAALTHVINAHVNRRTP